MTENSAQDPLTQLRKAIVAQKTAALPDQPPNPSLQQLHQAIVAYDRHVSQTVIAVLGGAYTIAPYPAAVELDPLINHHLADAEATTRGTLLLYQRYKERLDRMFSLAMQVTQSRQ